MANGKLQDHWSTCCGLRIFARVSPDRRRKSATPVVLVHGLAVSSRYLVPLAQALDPYFPVFVPDLPGFGKSERPSKTLDIQELAHVLSVWLRQRNLRNAAVIGNSMGCQVIAELANSSPDLIAAAVFLGPTMDPSGGVLGQVLRLARDQFREPPSLVALQAYDYLRAGTVRTLRTFTHAVRHDMLLRSRSVQVPTLVVRGSRDPIASQWWVERVARQLPFGRLQVIPGAGHALNYNSPVEVTRAVLQFLRSERIVKLAS